MRTTVTLDPDVEQLLRERMKAKGISFKRALNEAVRESSSVRADYQFRTPTFDLGTPQLDLTKAGQLAGELEDQELIAKMQRGR